MEPRDALLDSGSWDRTQVALLDAVYLGTNSGMFFLASLVFSIGTSMGLTGWSNGKGPWPLLLLAAVLALVVLVGCVRRNLKQYAVLKNGRVALGRIVATEPSIKIDRHGFVRGNLTVEYVIDGQTYSRVYKEYGEPQWWEKVALENIELLYNAQEPQEPALLLNRAQQIVDTSTNIKLYTIFQVTLPLIAFIGIPIYVMWST